MFVKEAAEMGVGERIKARRKEIGLSAEQVAKELGVSPATVYRYDSNDIIPFTLRTEQMPRLE